MFNYQGREAMAPKIWKFFLDIFGWPLQNLSLSQPTLYVLVFLHNSLNEFLSLYNCFFFFPTICFY